MRIVAISSSFPLFLISISALHISPSNFEPFFPSFVNGSLIITNGTLIPENEHIDLHKRETFCPENYNSCSTFAAADSGSCCTAGSVCTTDNSNIIACCPTSATCTGTVAAPTSTTIASTDATTTITASITYVTNSYFPFPYISTTFSNSAACNSAYQECQSNYALCTENLEGGGYGVTISAPGGQGVTATVTDLGVTSATSICSSLSSEACYGLQSDLCAQFGTATTTSTVFVFGTTKNAAARPTVGGMAAAGVMAGVVGLGIARQMV